MRFVETTTTTAEPFCPVLSRTKRLFRQIANLFHFSRSTTRFATKRGSYYYDTKPRPMLPSYLESICKSSLQGQVTISIVGDNASTHAKPADCKRRKTTGMRRCLTAPDLGSRQLLYKRRSSWDDSSLCRWDSAPSSPPSKGGSRRLTKDLPPVLKRSVGGPPLTMKKSTSLTTMGVMGDRPPTYIRRNCQMRSSSSDNNTPSPSTLLVINEVLGTAFDVDNIMDEPEPQEDEIPEEALSF